MHSEESSLNGFWNENYSISGKAYFHLNVALKHKFIHNLSPNSDRFWVRDIMAPFSFDNAAGQTIKFFVRIIQDTDVDRVWF